MRNKNFIVCVTGKSGVGKSMFSKMLAARLDFFYVDIDKIGHKIYEDKKVVEKVESIFQQKLTDENGNFDRKRLGGILFSEKDLSKVEKFNNFTKRCLITKMLFWIGFFCQKRYTGMGQITKF